MNQHIQRLLRRKLQPITQLAQRSFGGKLTKPEYYEDLISTLKRKKLLLRATMTKKRKVVIQPPSFISREPIRLPLFNLSELAGHGAFIFLAMSYLESDFLNLRLYAFSGITLSILFQYYREIPLWIPIRWNALFLLINTVMIGLLIKKQSDAANMTEDQKLLYEQSFKNKGMSQVDFFHLISMAKRMEAKKGTKLVSMDKKNTRLYLVQKGSLSVYKHDQNIGKISKTQFVGEMSYLRWQTKKHEKENMKLVEAEALKKQQEDDAHAATTLSWKTAEDALTNMLGAHPKDVFVGDVFMGDSEETVSEASSSSPVSATADANNSTTSNNSVVLTTAATEPASADVGANQTNKPVVTPANSSDGTTSGAVTTAVIAVEEDEGHLGQADVICDEDCVVYYWKFRDLYELISHNPLLGLVIERSFSEDLNNKMTNSWQGELMLRYKMLLGQAVQRFHQDKIQLHNHNLLLLQADVAEEDNTSSSSPKSSNSSRSSSSSIHHSNSSQQDKSAMTNRNRLHAHVDAKDVTDLQRFRQINNISDMDHERVLQEVLVEQEKRDQERMVEKVQETAVTKQYRMLLENEVLRPRGVSESAKRQLREYRLTHQIPADVHVALLADFGWTMDEYEMGRRFTKKDIQVYERARQNLLNASSNSTTSTSTTTATNATTTTSPASAKASSIDTLLRTRYGRNATSFYEEEDEEEEVGTGGGEKAATSSSSSSSSSQEKNSNSSGKNNNNNNGTSALEKRAARIQHALSQAGLSDSQHLGGDHPIEELHLHLVLDDDATHLPVLYTTTVHSSATKHARGAEESSSPRGSFLSRIGRGGLISALFSSSSSSSSSTDTATAAEAAEREEFVSQESDKSTDTTTRAAAEKVMSTDGQSSTPEFDRSLYENSNSKNNNNKDNNWVPGYFLYHAWSGVTSVIFGTSSSSSSSSPSPSSPSSSPTNTVIKDADGKAVTHRVEVQNSSIPVANEK